MVLYKCILLINNYHTQCQFFKRLHEQLHEQQHTFLFFKLVIQSATPAHHSQSPLWTCHSLGHIFPPPHISPHSALLQPPGFEPLLLLLLERWAPVAGHRSLDVMRAWPQGLTQCQHPQFLPGASYDQWHMQRSGTIAYLVLGTKHLQTKGFQNNKQATRVYLA